MIDVKKKYWLAFEPYVYITLRGESALVYNTLDGKGIKADQTEIIELVKKILDKQNNGVALVTPADMKSSVVYLFLEEVREGFYGDLYECSLSDKKTCSTVSCAKFARRSR